MIVFHGTTEIIEKPDVTHSKNNLILCVRVEKEN